MESIRLDKLLLQKGLVTSRHKAEMLIEDGGVCVDGKVITKCGKKISSTSQIKLVKEPMPWVSRGAYKLLAALDEWPIPVNGKKCLDVGASTGGFTQVLLSRGAMHVTAVDVGTNQLVPSLANHPAVYCLENQNIRGLDPNILPYRYELVVMDLSFISLNLIWPILPRFLSSEAQIVALVKPQFEVGKAHVGRGGIVRDERKRQKALDDVKLSAVQCGFNVLQTIDSPIEGGDGNHEYLIWLQWNI